MNQGMEFLRGCGNYQPSKQCIGVPEHLNYKLENGFSFYKKEGSIYVFA
jgi:hypothetical protein